MLPVTQHTFVEACRLALVKALLTAAPLAKALPVRPCPKGLDWEALPVRPWPKGLDWEAPKADGACELAAVLAAPKSDSPLWAVVPNANAPCVAVPKGPLGTAPDPCLVADAAVKALCNGAPEGCLLIPVDGCLLALADPVLRKALLGRAVEACWLTAAEGFAAETSLGKAPEPCLLAAAELDAAGGLPGKAPEPVATGSLWLDTAPEPVAGGALLLGNASDPCLLGAAGPGMPNALVGRMLDPFAKDAGGGLVPAELDANPKGGIG